jgi:UDP-4-amino-4,6-dideoxy-N-acetyl-beta-L-altrosamine N-acetyltransferase
MEIDLKKISLDDLELIRIWRNSDDVAKYMYTSHEISKDEQIAWFNKISNDNTQQHWVIFVDGNPTGLASVTGINTILKSCYWAFYLGDTNNRGGGIGANVEFKVIEYVFENLGLNKLRCEVLASNEKVIQMHEKFGFRREAFYRQHVYKDNRFHDVVGLALLKYDWGLLKEIMKNKILRFK